MRDILGLIVLGFLDDPDGRAVRICIHLLNCKVYMGKLVTVSKSNGTEEDVAEIT